MSLPLEQMLTVLKIKRIAKAYDSTRDLYEKHWMDAELEVLTRQLENIDRKLKCQNCKQCGNVIEKRENESKTISFGDAISYLASHSKDMDATEFEKLKNKVMSLVSREDKNRLAKIYQQWGRSVL